VWLTDSYGETFMMITLKDSGKNLSLYKGTEKSDPQVETSMNYNVWILHVL
jgi:hypothetical protein